MNGNSSKKVYVRVTDGLGNQMFQYAAGRALAIQNNATLVLEPSIDLFKLRKTGRRFGLDRFLLSSNVITHYPNPLSKLVKFKQKDKSDIQLIKEGNSYRFQKEIGEAQTPIRICGYFQSTTYFSSMPRSQMIKEFSLQNKLSVDAESLVNRFRGKNSSVCLHLRLGDYTKSPIFNTLTEKYYQSALRKIEGSLTEKPVICVFSNGTKQEVLNRCIRMGVPDAYIETRETIPEWELIHVMSSFQHHIIANSTFSWWAAWLKGNTGITIMPKQWFKEASWDVNELRVPEWLQI